MTEYITNIPFDKHTAIEAINSGKVKLQVVINDVVPFTRSSRVDDALIFNAQSMAGFSESVLNKISAVAGTEGVFMRPEINYRNNFIMAYKKSDRGIRSRDYVPNSVLFQNNKEPDYKEEFIWVISPSFYNNNIVKPSEYNTVRQPNANEEGCLACPIWEYATINRGIHIQDDENATILRQIGNRVLEFFSQRPFVQYPAQVATDTTNAAGVHWHVEKLTPVFRGMDFFIEFKRVARSTSIAQQVPTWSQDNLRCINAAAGLNLMRFSGFRIPANQGVVAYNNNNGDWETTNDDFFRLDNQGYYVIEMGVGDPDENYFLFITERGPIRLVRIKNGISWVVSQYGGRIVFDNVNESGQTQGSSLLYSDDFRIEVRNHLGKMIIQFVAAGMQADPWIISRVDDIEDNSLRTTGKTQQTVVPMIVPRGKIGIWGGNILTSFVYGPIQYSQKNDTTGVSINLPARSNSAYGFDVEVSDDQGRPIDNTFALPDYADHTISFSTSDTIPEVSLGSSRNNTRSRRVSKQGRYYTCDAHQVGEIINDAYESRSTYFQNSYDIKERTNRNIASSYKKSAIDSLLSVRKIQESTDESTLNKTFRLQITMRAGNHIFRNNGKVWELPRCKTPVMNILKLRAEPNDINRWSKEPIDVTDHVLSFNESWSTSDYKSIEHTGSISFLLNPGAIYDRDYTEELESLRNKAFYIEVWGGYDNCNYSRLPDDFKLFTGVCFGGKLSKEIGKRTLECEIHDYSKILKDQLFFNSPFFDGVVDSVAIDEILRIAGFQYQDHSDPGFLVHSAAKATGNDEIYRTVGRDGRWIEVKKWALPQAYNILEQPAFKFPDASPLMDGITEITKKSGKVFFFDVHGQAHYENYQDSVMEIVRGQRSANPLFAFTTDPATFEGQQIFNAVSVEHDVQSVYNHVRVMTNTPGLGDSGSQAPVFGDEIDWASVHDPNKEGFLGYLRTVYQEEGMFGSEEALRDLVEYYKVFRRPPYVVNFETYGQPIRALDIVQLNNQPLRVVRVDSNFDPNENVWWQKLECEWFQPISEN